MSESPTPDNGAEVVVVGKTDDQSFEELMAESGFPEGSIVQTFDMDSPVLPSFLDSLGVQLSQSAAVLAMRDDRVGCDHVVSIFNQVGGGVRATLYIAAGGTINNLGIPTTFEKEIHLGPEDFQTGRYPEIDTKDTDAVLAVILHRVKKEGIELLEARRADARVEALKGAEDPAIGEQRVTDLRESVGEKISRVQRV